MAVAPWGSGNASGRRKKKRNPYSAYGIDLSAWNGPAGASAVDSQKQGANVWGNYFSSGKAGADYRNGGGYGDAINSMPDLSALESMFKAQSSEDQAAMQAALRRFIISYGSLPDLDQLGISGRAKGYLQKALDDKTLDLARKAEEEGLSIHARQAHDNDVYMRRIPSALAGRGLLRSGQTGYDLGEQAQNYKTQQYDTLNELLGSVEGTVGNFLRAERDRQMQLEMAKMQAAWDAYGEYGDYPMGDEPHYPGGASGGKSAGQQAIYNAGQAAMAKSPRRTKRKRRKYRGNQNPGMGN